MQTNNSHNESDAASNGQTSEVGQSIGEGSPDHSANLSQSNSCDHHVDASNSQSHDCTHSHDSHHHSHTCSHEAALPADSLWEYIDHDKVRCLNESEEGAARAIIRPYPERLNSSPMLESDVDPELLIIIPFTGLVQLHAVHVRSTVDDRAPRDLKLFKNREDLDFDTAADLPPTQALEHPHGIGLGSSLNNGIVEYAVSRAKFSNVTSLALYVPENWGDETTALAYIGLTGTCKKLSKAPVVAMYEAAANPADHRMKNRIGHGAAIQ